MRTLLVTPFCELRPDMVPLLHFFSVSLIFFLLVLGFLPIKLGLMRNSERFGFPTFCRSGRREASHEEFAEEVDGWLTLLLVISLPDLTGEMLADVVRHEGATAGSLDGWGWRESKVLLVAWYDGLACILTVNLDVRTMVSPTL